MGKTEIYDDLKANFRSWESDCEEDAERLASILMSRHPGMLYEEVLAIAKHWVGATEKEEFEEPYVEPGIRTQAYDDLNTNFRAWMINHEDQVVRLADMLVDRHPGLSRHAALEISRQWTGLE